MSRCGDYDFPAPPPMTEEFECIPLYEQPQAITEQPERLYRGQSERPYLPEKTLKGQYYGGKEGKRPSHQQWLMSPQGRETDSRLLRADPVAGVTAQSKTMPRSGLLHTDPVADQAKPSSTISGPPPYAADQYSQGQKTGPEQSPRPHPVAQKPGQRPEFNYVSYTSKRGFQKVRRLPS